MFNCLHQLIFNIEQIGDDGENVNNYGGLKAPIHSTALILN